MTGEALTDRIKIPAVRRGLIDVHAGRDSVPTRKAVKPIDTPAEMAGNRTVGLIQSPLQEGIMAAQDDVGQSACIGCGVRDLCGSMPARGKSSFPVALVQGICCRATRS